ncbi:hypothetical protein V7S43_014138 [Phytophthora oleae]|uniref:Uncharacterized protein n=1 Tax=Phytophthora oleae TaxID=2107226 RepID=A0ABD3F1P5_9STRA
MPRANGAIARHAPVVQKAQLGFRGFDSNFEGLEPQVEARRQRYQCFQVEAKAAMLDTSSLRREGVTETAMPSSTGLCDSGGAVVMMQTRTS